MSRSFFYSLFFLSALYAGYSAPWRAPAASAAGESTSVFSLESVAAPVTRMLRSIVRFPGGAPETPASEEEAPALNAAPGGAGAGTAIKRAATKDLDLPKWIEEFLTSDEWADKDETEIRAAIAAAVRRAGFAGSGAASLGAKKGEDAPRGAAPGPFSYRVRAFYPGTGAYGQPIAASGVVTDALLSKVVGPPDYSGWSQEDQSDRVLSLGANGILILEVEGGFITDGEGPDFAIFENPFVVAGTGSQVFAETARVSVAEEDREDAYRTLPCDSANAPFTGCAGVKPVVYHPDLPLDQVGGDLFDLKAVNLPRAKFIRIQDTGDQASLFPGKEGFDLDAIALLRTEAP